MAVDRAAELNGRLVEHRGCRLTDLSFNDVLDLAYSVVVSAADPLWRRKLDAALVGKLGPSGKVVVDNPNLPKNLQGKEAPDWWVKTPSTGVDGSGRLRGPVKKVDRAKFSRR